ncbi:ion channel [Paraclostridium bifermentans]|uniref:ion channel n=1 Tax=Paraclostridium bifermentans TaxID=1490 RepID=UPI001F2F80D5|nr:ion channel [Paraclostridium bifermentans]MCE9675369.1 ion channel [Paraclostridium bifermentans]
MKKIYVVKKKRNVRKVQIPILILGYIGLYININVFTLGQWATSYGGVILGVIYFFILSIIIILWTIITIIWVFRIPKDYNDLKSSVIVFGIITLVLLSSTIFYANLFEDYNNYYTFIDVNESNGLFLSDGSRVKSKIDYLYFSSVMIFTIGYDEVSILGSGLKIIVASEMFVSYLLMCIFVPSIFTLISSRE